VTKGVER